MTDARPRWRLALAITLAGLALTIGLGIWQVQRLAWKTGVLAAIDRAEAGPAIPLRGDPPAFAKVRADGRFDPGHAVFYGVQVRGGQAGARLLVPLLREDAPPVLVDRGFVPLPWSGATPQGPVSVEAYVRPGEARGWFSLADDLAGRRFYTLDPAAIGRAIGLPDLAPYVLVALGPPPAPGAPVPATAMPRPPNNHLGYAVTWFGLAAALAAVFVIWWNRERRRR